MAALSRFSTVELAPPIEVFHVNKCCVDDPSPDKVNLSIGAYRTEEGQPWVLPAVREAERRLATDMTINHEYLPVLGMEQFAVAASQLLLGVDHPAFAAGKVASIQCLSGTGALRVGADFLARVVGYKVCSFSKPTWGNHRMIFRDAGFTEFKGYTYWSQQKRAIDFENLIKDLEEYEEHTVVVFHGCAHNPTGMDPTKEQWQKICDVVKRRKLFPFMDIAYQGFASGNPDEDAWAVRFFASQGLEMLVAQSFAKNFGLYNERVGNLTLITNEPSSLPSIRSQISLLVRANYSNPPAHGARVVHMVLSDSNLRTQWFDHIVTMSSRIKQMRDALRKLLEEQNTPGSWEHITKQIGMFSYTGLSEKQVELMTKKYHIYLLKDGRINMCGLNTKNVEYVAKAMHDAVTTATASI